MGCKLSAITRLKPSKGYILHYLALKRNTRYTRSHVTHAKQEHVTRVGLTDSSVAAQTDKSAREDLAEITEARGGGD